MENYHEPNQHFEIENSYQFERKINTFNNRAFYGNASPNLITSNQKLIHSLPRHFPQEHRMANSNQTNPHIQIINRRKLIRQMAVFPLLICIFPY